MNIGYKDLQKEKQSDRDLENLPTLTMVLSSLGFVCAIVTFLFLASLFKGFEPRGGLENGSKQPQKVLFAC